jgi:hypothetical protein|uniref:Uncharacterized protein n=1 Tax=Zea mays TaxID=4577 RepID=A0A804PT34_MAIZE
MAHGPTLLPPRRPPPLPSSIHHPRLVSSIAAPTSIHPFVPSSLHTNERRLGRRRRRYRRDAERSRRRSNGWEVAATEPEPAVPEDYWSEGETSTLVDGWGSRYLDLNRESLR